VRSKVFLTHWPHSLMNHIKKELQSLAMIKENITKLDKRKKLLFEVREQG
jgi:hypothetical protein